MARRFRKRRRRGAWLPVFGTGALAVATEDTDAGSVTPRVFDVLVPGDGHTLTIVTPVTFDEPHDEGEDASTVSMADAIGSGYILRRIVGKAWFSVAQDPANDNPGVLIGLGFLVARASDSTTLAPDAEQVPLGFVPEGDNFDVLSPLNQREPWIWRRTWLLSNQQTSSVGGAGRDTYPRNTAEYGSVMDGPHLDAKTIRKIVGDDRLWLAFSATRSTINDDPEQPDLAGLPLTGVVDFRLFGHLTRQRSKGSF